jgi:hypothetical protein
VESIRDVKRMIEREIKKGSAPLMLDRIEYTPNTLREITSESKLKNVLAYLLRTAEYEKLANDMTRNNVYTENNLIQGDSFHRRNNVIERNANYLNIMAYAKRCAPEYNHKTFVETLMCFFSLPEEDMQKYSFAYNGAETYAFPLSGKHIINGLYLLSVMYRKALAGGETPEYIIIKEHEKIYHLEDIRKVLFQCLILDDMHINNGMFDAKLYTIYLL